VIDEVQEIEDQDYVRSRLRDSASASTYVMAKAVLGFKDVTPALHAQMATWIEGPARRKLGLVPRDHLKTSIWTIADTLRLVVCNPNIRILLANETATNASHFLRRIQAVFERNAIFRWLWPELIPDFSKRPKWSETEMCVPRSDDYPESTIEVIGVGGAVVSRHYTRIKLDDLVGKEASESADVMRKTIDWYLYCESLLVNPRDGIDLYGTRWAYNDLYAWAEKNEEDLDVFFRSSYEAGEPIWPERFNFVELERIRKKIGSFKFSCQYLNKPYDPEATSFDPSWLRFYALWADQCVAEGLVEGPRWGEMVRHMLVDPAISERSTAARTAIVVTGASSDGRKFVLDAWADRCQPFRMFEKIFELQDKWDCEAVGVENVQYQRAIKPFLEAESQRRGRWINVRELKPDVRVKKEGRIRALQPYFERGEIFMRREMRELLGEYESFPVGATVDLLDALAYGPFLWDLEEDTRTIAEEEREYNEFRYESGRSAVTGY
jgi:predicted phage terminase large subunit-like protein